jgi:predicted glycoside hydrolase/deacetylase ChbG (UPF0249 family)
MINRRNFIKQVAAAGIAGSMPSALFARQSSAQPIELLIRGDDMGKNYGRTLGFFKSFKEGVLTSASIMATSVYFMESVKFCNENPKLAAGVHSVIIDGTQRPVLSPREVPSLVDPRGFFWDTDEQFKAANPKFEEVDKEIRAQVEKARSAGLKFVYVDNHRGGAIVDDVIIQICKGQKLIYGRDYEGKLYGYKRVSLLKGERFPHQELPDGGRAYYAAPALTEEEKQVFFDNLSALKPGKWITVVHPGWADPNRASTTELLCSPKTKEIIQKKNIRLVSYRDLWNEEFG